MQAFVAVKPVDINRPWMLNVKPSNHAVALPGTITWPPARVLHSEFGDNILKFRLFFQFDFNF